MQIFFKYESLTININLMQPEFHHSLTGISAVCDLRIIKQTKDKLTFLLIAFLLNSISSAYAQMCSSPGFAAPVSYAVGTSPLSIAATDLNSDGKIDLAVGNNGNNNVSVLMGNGDGSFATAVNYPAGTGVYSVAAGDLNGDGKPDLATANIGGGNISVLINNGNGTFASPVNYASGANPYFVAMGDVNGDGKPDLASPNGSSNNVQVLINNGNGTFAAPVSYTTALFPQAMAIGDVSGDGKADLAIVAYSNTISVLINNGNGTFGAATNYGVASHPSSIGIKDFNGDGKADLAATNSGSNNISVLLNSGTGTFAASVTYPTGTAPYTLATADINNDGKIDLASSNGSSNNVSVLLGNGNGTFATAVNFSAGTNPVYVATGDLNSDGKADVAVANSSANSVSVLLNNCISTLPLIITSVKASHKPGGIQVEWTTENEDNMDHFEIQKSRTGQHFEKLAIIPVKGRPSKYAWLDVNAEPDNNYYRVKSISRSGEQTFSSIVTVYIGNKNGIGTYPNPLTNGQLTVQFNNIERGAYLITLYNAAGQMVLSKKISHEGRSASVTVQPDYKLSPGTYLLRVQGNDGLFNQKVVVE